MWKMKRRRFVRMKLVSIPSSLFPLHPTYGPNPLVLCPPSSSPLPNIANHGTTSHRSAVTANPSLGIQPEPVHLRTFAYPNLTPCHPIYTPDFTAAHSQTNILRTSAPPNPFPQNQTYQFDHLHFNNPITHPVYGHVANIPRIPSSLAIIATSYVASQRKVAYTCPRCSRTNIAWRRVEVCRDPDPFLFLFPFLSFLSLFPLLFLPLTLSLSFLIDTLQPSPWTNH